MLLAAVGVVAVTLAGFAAVARQDAASSFANAESQRLGAEANVSLYRGESAELAALLAIRGLESQYTPQADGALQRASRYEFSDRILSFPPGADGISTPLTRVLGVDISHDGRSLLAVVDDGNNYVLDLAHDGALVYKLPSAGGIVNAGAFSPDGTKVATLGGAKLQVWDMATGKERWSAPTTFGGLARLTFSSDSRELATVQATGVSLFDASGGSVIGQVPKADNVVMAPDGETAYIVMNKVGGLWDLDRHPSTGPQRSGHGFQQLRRVLARRSSPGHLGFGPHDPPLGRRHGDARPDADWPHGDRLPAHLLARWRDTAQRQPRRYGPTVGCGAGATLRTFVGHTARSTRSVDAGREVRSHRWKGRHGAILGRHRTVERDTLLGATSFTYGMAWSPDGRQLFVGSGDGTAKSGCRNADRDARPDDRSAHRRSGLLAGWSHAAHGPGRRSERPVGSSHWDTDRRAPGVRRWQERSGHGQLQREREMGSRAPATADQRRATGGRERGCRHPPVAAAVRNQWRERRALSPDGSLLFTFADGPVVPNGTIWDVATGTKLRTVAEPAGMIDGTFSPDGTTILTVGRDDVGHLWDAATGQQLHELRGDTNIMWRGIFSPDGRYVFTTSQDKSARMWDVRTGQQVRYFPGHALSAVAGVAVSPDGSEIAIGSYDGAIQLTPTSGAALISQVCSRLRRDLTAVERTIYDITDPAATCRGG